MKNWSWADVFTCLFLVLILLVAPAIMVGIGRGYRQKATAMENGLPRMDIVLNGVTLEDINNTMKVIKYPGNKVVVTRENGTHEYTGVEISGRGNSSWASEKKPYNLKFAHRVDLFGGEKAKSWVLLANAYDSTYLRNDVALHLAGMLDDKYAAKGNFVELYVDDKYIGLYYSAPKITINKGSVNLKDSLGVLVELDNLYGVGSSCYYSYMGNCLTVKDAVRKDNINQAMEEFLIDFDKLEMAAEAGNYAVVEELIDVESFAKYYLVSEFTSNPDAYSTSWFMYKDGTGDKIHAGPVWDFDFALANRNWGGSGLFSPEDSRTREKEVFGGGYYDDNNEYIEVAQNATISKLMYLLMKMPEFRDAVEDVFAEKMSGRADELVQWVERQSKLIEKAAKKDADKWEITDIDSDVQKLIEWIKRRYTFFEKEYQAVK